MKNSFKLHWLLALVFSLCLPEIIFAQIKKTEKITRNIKITKDENGKQKKVIVITKDVDGDEKQTYEIVMQADTIILNGEPVDKNDPSLNIHSFTFPDNISILSNDFNVDSFFKSKSLNNYQTSKNKAKLGVYTQNTNDDVIITKIFKGSSAEKAGLKVDDILLKINEDKVSEDNNLTKLIGKYNPGDKIKMTYKRDGKEQTTDAVLEKTKGDAEEFFLEAESYPTFKNLKIDPFEKGNYKMAVPHFQFDNAQKLGAKIQDVDEGKGAKIIEIAAGSNAEKAGLKVDDIITHINDVEVEEVDDASELIRENKAKSSVKIDILRNGKKETITVKMPKKLKKADL